uniref:Zinc finger MYM-type protein 1 n=1 Tax=Lygus hesperus TaxID=30085 RepID=A0A146L068_LYGHE
MFSPSSNTVAALQSKFATARSFDERVFIKNLGRDIPLLTINQVENRSTRRFNVNIYKQHEWITNCPKMNALFCFPCLLLGGDPLWTIRGVVDLKHLRERIKSHESNKKHLHNTTELALLGRSNIAVQLDSARQLAVIKHNEQVDRNRYILSEIIDCIKFCGLYEIGLRGHDERESSLNRGIFLGLVTKSAKTDDILRSHLEKATIFKGTSKTIQNELLDCIFCCAKKLPLKE